MTTIETTPEPTAEWESRQARRLLGQSAPYRAL